MSVRRREFLFIDCEIITCLLKSATGGIRSKVMLKDEREKESVLSRETEKPLIQRKNKAEIERGMELWRVVKRFSVFWTKHIRHVFWHDCEKSS